MSRRGRFGALVRSLLAAVEWPLRVDTVRASACDVIVVLGARCRGGEPGRFAGERAHYAAELWARGVAPMILVTGGKPEHGVSEAAVLARSLERLGVPRDRMVLEEQSRSTYENAARCAPIVRARGWQRVLLVTQGFHARRARRHFRAFGIPAEVVQLEVPSGGETQLRPWRGLSFVAREYLAWLSSPLVRR